jgi:hypothetical protein
MSIFANVNHKISAYWNEYGEGNVFDLHNEEDAAAPRRRSLKHSACGNYAHPRGLRVSVRAG